MSTPRCGRSSLSRTTSWPRTAQPSTASSTKRGRAQLPEAPRDAEGPRLLRAALRRAWSSATLVVVKNLPPPKPQQAVRLSAPAFLFLLTLLSVFVTGYVVAVIFPQIAPGSSVLGMGLGFAACLIAVFVLRYLAQRYAAKRGSFSGLSYYLPNVPLFIAIPDDVLPPNFRGGELPWLPSCQQGQALRLLPPRLARHGRRRRRRLDPGAGSSVVLTQAQYAALSAGNQTSTIQTNPSILQSGVISLAQSLGLLGQVPAGGRSIFSPIEIAAWLGLLLAFFNLMPAALFDGGRMARLVIGEMASRVTTVLSGISLLLIDLPDYWVVFLLVFLMAAFPVQEETLDSVTELSNSRRAVFVIAVVVGILLRPDATELRDLPSQGSTVSQARVTTLSFADRPAEAKTLPSASPEPRAVLNLSFPPA